MSRKIIKFTLAATTALSWAVPAFAEDVAKDSGDIIVTARRIEERLQDVPISITVMNQQTLNDRNISNAADLGTYTPSLSTNSRYGPEQASFSIRGFYQENGTAPSVGVYFADVVVPRASGTIPTGNGGGVGQMFDLQNVQVLKGPQGTLQGRNTTGGAILLVPQKPTSKFEGYVEGSVGNYDMKRVQAVVNIPASDTFRIRGGVDWQKRDGYLSNKSGVGPDRLADTDYIAARLSVVADLTPNLENYMIASYSYSHTNGSALKALECNPAAGFAFFACGQIARQNARGDGFWDVENADPNPMYRIRQWQVINTTTWRATDNLTIKNIISYAEVKAFTSGSLFGDNFLLPISATASIPLTTLIYHPGRFGPSSSESTFTEELQFQGNGLDGRLKWQAGAYLEVSKPLGTNSQLTQIFASCTDVATFQCNSGPLGFGSLTDTSTADTFNGKGFYTQATYEFTDKLSATGGFRYTIDKQTQVAQNAVVFLPAPNTPQFHCQDIIHFPTFGVVSSPTQCRATLYQRSEKPTWLIDFDYKPTDDMLIYIKYARGYRAGGINSTNVNSSNPTWNPEKVDTYETGFKTSFRGAVSGNLNIAAFYNKFANQQLSANVFPTTLGQTTYGLAQNQVILNAGKSRIWGIEVDASLSPVKGLRFDLGYAYLNTKLQSIQNFPATLYYQTPIPNALDSAACAAAAAAGSPIAGCNELAFSPRNRVTLTASYTLPLSENIGEVTLGATFAHTDRNNSLSAKASPHLYRNPEQNLLNLNVNWKSVFGSSIDAAFFMTNVTNEKDYLSDGGGYGGIGLDAVVVAPPRMYGFRLKYRFGQ